MLMRPAALYSTTIWLGGAADPGARTCGGRSASSAFCVSGSAARKITIRTSRTSMRREIGIGVETGHWTSCEVGHRRRKLGIWNLEFGIRRSRHEKKGDPERVALHEFQILNSKFLIASRRRPSGLAHAFGDDADLLDAGALGGVDHVDDVAVAQRAGR